MIQAKSATTFCRGFPACDIALRKCRTEIGMGKTLEGKQYCLA